MAQMEIAAGQPLKNAAKMLRLIEGAKEQGAEILIFPHMAIAGLMSGGMLKRPAFIRDCKSYTSEVIKASKGITIIFDNENGELMIAQNGKLVEREETIDEAVKLRIGGRDIIFHATFDDGEFEADFDLTLERLDFNVIFASVPYYQDNKTRSKIFSKQARMSGCPIIYVNNVGVQNKGKTIYTFEGASTVYNSKGEIVIQAERFNETLTLVELSEIERLQPIKGYDELEIAGIYQALHSGVGKFLEQIGMSKIVIGISGGIDSAVAAALYTKILGAENVLLVNMPSVFNSATTRGLSERLAKNLGCNYMVVPIQESVDRTIKQLESTPLIYLTNGTERKLTLSPLAKENLQARDRSGRVLATLAAVFGGGFTCNANKAETTVGYATMYGDSAGVVCALADLWKRQVYELACYMNDEIYLREVIPQGIIDIVPSAELSTAQNVDEGKGDPLKYDYHDYLLRAFVECGALPEDILAWYIEGSLETRIGCAAGLIKKYFTSAEEFIADVERWWRQFTGIAVAKRIQAPPVMALSRNSFGADFEEAQNGVYYTRNYEELKKKLLKHK